MPPKAPLHSFRYSRGTILARLDRLAEEASETDGMAEHADKADDPIRWENGRLTRSGGAWCYVVMDDSSQQLRIAVKRKGSR